MLSNLNGNLLYIKIEKINKMMYNKQNNNTIKVFFCFLASNENIKKL